MEKGKEKRGSFRKSFGFVLAAAGSAVGLGNIWRFPYLAARDGGGLFLVVYIILALTFGFCMLTTETAIGRKTRQSPLTAYRALNRKWGAMGPLACSIPLIIMPYYCTIGGWVLKYFTAFITGKGAEAAADGYFTEFITGRTEPVAFLVLFLGLCAVIVFFGVEGGIERFSRILMPALIVLVAGIAVFSLTISRTGADGKAVTGLDGLRVYLVPSLEGLTLTGFLRIITDALTQMFYSLSIAMGIMIAYGSYLPEKANLPRAISQIEIFDTAVALMAGVMIIPAVYVFQGAEGLSASGPSLMFVTLPKVFMQMGPVGHFIGALFFAMVFFAALTSGISIMEAVVSSLMDRFRASRRKAVAIETAIALAVGVIVCFGYNLLYFEAKLPNGRTAQILDLLDYASNNILMPILALATCILVGWMMKPETVTDEAVRNGERMRRKGLYRIMIRFAAPLLILVILLLSVGIVPAD